MKIQVSPFLTPGAADFEAALSRTHAGSGPDGTTCGQCLHLGSFKAGVRGKDAAPCAKFESLTGGNGPRVPHYAPSCRHFEPNSTVAARQA
jgi:hypothetical protein